MWACATTSPASTTSRGGDAWLVEIAFTLGEVARQHGYALAVHGSLERDIDLIAVPWTEGATKPDSLALALFHVCEAVFTAQWPAPESPPAPGSLLNPVVKPYGRLGWVVHLPGTYIDLSVVCPQTKQGSP